MIKRERVSIQFQTSLSHTSVSVLVLVMAGKGLISLKLVKTKRTASTASILKNHQNQVLENVSSTKYLGVTLQHNAKFNQHNDAVVAKTNRTLGFLRRNLRIGESNIKAQAYRSLSLVHQSWSTHALCRILQHKKTLTGSQICPELAPEDSKHQANAAGT